jgi:chromosomal replication initiation ATPase DnaA
MTEQKHIEVLLRNIQEGIRLYGVKELNEAITKTLYSKTDKADEIDFILNMVANDFNLSRHSMIKSKKHGYPQKARQLAYCLLYFDIGLSLREIGSIFGKYVRSISIAIENYRKINPDIKPDKEFLEKYNFYQQKILLYINEKNKQTI